MKIFLSHADEQQQVAKKIAIALRNAGHTVFLDKDDLPPGGDYNARLYRAIKRSDLFIYGISPESVAEGSYARTELLFAEKRFRKAVNHLLPVMLVPTPYDQVPAYAGSVTILNNTGNMVAEVVQAVADIEGGLAGERLNARQLAHLLLLVLAAGLLLNAVYQWSYPRFEVTWVVVLLSMAVLVLTALIYGYRSYLFITGSILSWGLSVAACLVLAGAGWLCMQYRPMVVWLLPGSSIMANVPSDEGASKFTLDVRSNDIDRTLERFGKSGVVIGATQTIVDLALRRYSDLTEAVLNHYLDERHVPQEHHTAYLALWRMQSGIATGFTLYRGTDIAVNVNKSGTAVTALALISLHGEMPLRIAFVDSH